MEIQVKFHHKIFASVPMSNKPQYVVAQYMCATKPVVAVGYELPMMKDQLYTFVGEWETSRYGPQFRVEYWEGSDEIQATEEGIIAFLKSQVKGIGPKRANAIYQRFGQDTLNVIANNPNRLLEISGISKQLLIDIVVSYKKNRQYRQIIAFLAPLGISPRKAMQIFDTYGGSRAINIIEENPYVLTELTGIAFKTADKLAQRLGIEKNSSSRIEAAIVWALIQSEDTGHLYSGEPYLVNDVIKHLNCEIVSPRMIKAHIFGMVQRGVLQHSGDQICRGWVATAEEKLASMIAEKMMQPAKTFTVDLAAQFSDVEEILAIELTGEQKSAVLSAVTNRISIVTGGPGTGKTAIQKSILQLIRKINPFSKILCCAPTGKAARLMERSTGEPASTIHRALGLVADEDGKFGEPAKLDDVNYVLVDEASMLDIHMAIKLLHAVPLNASVIFLGDLDQLPSVGPGSVLADLINSRTIPMVKLTRMFRQAVGSTIATNAWRVNRKCSDLLWNDEFKFIPAIEDVPETLAAIYLELVGRVGLDEVALLTPYRRNTDSSSNNLNKMVQEHINPHSDDMGEAKYGEKIYRVGDKIMQWKNFGEVNNGDTGYVVQARMTDDGMPIVRVDFGGDRVIDYTGEELEMLDLGYASTIHKSQGDSYDAVIINVQKGHRAMLTRSMLYTAITRAKTCVYVVGDYDTFVDVIENGKTNWRNTRLKERLCYALNALPENTPNL